MRKCTGADHIFDSTRSCVGQRKLTLWLKKCTALNYFLHSCLNAYLYILTDFNYATLTSLYIFKNIVVRKIPLAWMISSLVSFFSKHLSFNCRTKLDDVICFA